MGYTPELGTDFDTVTNLNNSDSRYNIRLFVSRVFARWRVYLQGCLQYYTGQSFNYASGEGNVNAKVKFSSGDPEHITEDNVDGISENESIGLENSNLILPNRYRVTGVPITWAQYKTIRDNKKKAIGIPYNGTIRGMFIIRLSYKFMKGTFDADLIETQPNQADDPMLWQDEVVIAWQDGAVAQWN